MLGEVIYVLDTSAIIAVKQVVKAKEQWGFTKHLERLVKSRHITFPHQVAREVRGQRYVDLPEAWTLGVEPHIGLRRRPDPEHVEQVMAVASDVVEANAENDPADPYVLSLALQLWREEESKECYVITEDNVDRVPLKTSIRTACLRLGLDYMDTRDFADAIGFGHVLRPRRS